MDSQAELACPDERFFEPLPGRMVNAGGFRLFVAERGEGPALVLIHGLGWTHALWHAQIARYSSQYKVIAGDTRGHGESDAPPGPYSMRELAADWAALIAACGVTRFALVGFSQGGMIAMLLAATDPQRVAALGLFGTTFHFTDAAWSGMQQRALAARAAGPRAAAELAARSIFSERFAHAHPAFVASFIGRRTVANIDALAAATQSLHGFDMRDRLAAIACPVLIAHGTADQVIAADDARALHRLLPQSDIHLIEAAGHMLPVERPDEMNTQLDRFLNTHYRSEDTR